VTEDLGLALQKAASGVIEKLTFLLPARSVDAPQQNAPFDLAASVDFRGPMCGKLVVAVYGGLAKSMAANMLGGSGSPTEFQQRDALKEIANVICGNVLPLLEGAEVVYDIAAPVILDETDLAGSAPEELSARIQMGIDSGRAEIQLLCHKSPDVADAELQP
jgi:CheY-specific phosphatase CheX